MTATRSVDELAQNALGAVFEQLERVAAMGRERCRTTTYGATPTPPLTRKEAVRLIRYAENALDYARVHLDYLATARDKDLPMRPGDRVEVIDREAGDAWLGTLHELKADGHVYVRRDDGGDVVPCHPLDVNRAPSEAAE